MIDKRYNIAVVGCGRISKKHFDAIYENRESLNLVAACDISIAHRQSVPTDVPLYTSYEELLKDQQLDIISLCTPSGLHAKQAILAARSGIHVITEKPMATRWSDAKKMIDIFGREDRQLFVVKQNRLNPTIQLVKKTLCKGWFGRLHTLQANVFWTRPQSYYDQADWRGTWEFDGGALMNQASHYVDLLEWLGGPVECVQSMMATQARNIEVEDSAVVNLKWRGGALGKITVTMLTYPQNLEGSITLLGDRGSVKIGGSALNSVEYWEFDSLDAPTKEEACSCNYETVSLYGNGHLPYYRNVVETLNGSSTATSDGLEGLRSLELLIACYRSAQKRQAIAFPLED